MRTAKALLVGALLSAIASGERIRVATFNLGDVRGAALAEGADERLRALAGVIQAIRPDVLLLNEIETDPSAPERHARRFVEQYLARAQAAGLEGLTFDVFSAPSNTGVHSGFDLDRDGQAERDASGRAYAGDCWGYGEFPGQYGMALLVRAPLTIERKRVRTFRTFRWKDMPGALLPARESGGEAAWYEPDALGEFPLSSKSHWDVPVRTASGALVHALCAHPTPPVFDGPEDRNGRRNHDEIRFWREYLSGAEWIVDDAGGRAPLAADAHALILGDLNADPVDGDSRDNPAGALLAHARLAAHAAPASLVPVARLDPSDTSRFRLRVDYVLPTATLPLLGSGVWRGSADGPASGGVAWTPGGPFPSDHFPVWVDVDVPAPSPAR